MFLPQDDAIQLPAGTHGIYSDLACTTRIGVLDVRTTVPGYERWHWQQGEGFDKYQGDNSTMCFVKIGAAPGQPWPGTVHDYPSQDLPSGTQTVPLLAGDYLEITLGGDGSKVVGWLRWTAQSSPDGQDELEWFVKPLHRDANTARINLAAGTVIQLRQPLFSIQNATVHVVKGARRP